MSRRSPTPVHVAEELRIRLEGRLEEVEGAIQAVERLRSLLPSDWCAEPRELLERVRAWRALQPGLEAAVREVGRFPEARPVIAQLEGDRDRLFRELRRMERGVRLPAGQALDDALEIWLIVAKPFAVEPRPHLLEGTARVRPAFFFTSLVAATALAFTNSLAAVAIGLAAACTAAIVQLRRARWRLYDDSLEISERAGAVFRIPLESLTRVEHDAVTLTVEGLYRVDLITDDVTSLGRLAKALRPHVRSASP